MTARPTQPPAQAFFLQANEGNRFCMYYPSAIDGMCAGAVLYVAPFAEEMNKSRRMAALQARALSAKGYAVLQIDLFACGDSTGTFGEARWEIWKDDLALAVAWLRNAAAAPISVWALRLGALLAADFIRNSDLAFDNLLLWQPALEGKNFLTQFLRLRLAGDMLADAKREPMTVNALRDQLAAGHSVEVAGYELSPELAKAIDGAELPGTLANVNKIHWFEVVPEASQDISPGRRKLLHAVSSSAGPALLHLVSGDQFWVAPEPADCPALISATLAALGEG
jgi:exosortase A-associated hydrolase 2